jgi:hypothetical protein
MVDFYEDDKVFDLLDRYGPLGVTVYDCILCIVYRHGYYAEIPLDKLSKMIVKMIGNKWVKNTKTVVQVVHFCSEIGLLDDDLMTKNIITSVGIQRRFYKIAVKLMKRQFHKSEYWLLENEEKEEPLLNAPKNGINSEINGINSELNQLSSEKSTIKLKENKRIDIYTAPPDNHAFEKPFENQELEEAFQFYLMCRSRNGANLLPEQIQALREDLLAVSDTDAGRIAAARKAAVSGWLSFYPVKRQQAPGKEKKQPAKATAKAGSRNRFNNFEQRSYDYGQLERQLLAGDENRDN